jgi:signal transduction histidine kinase
VSARDDGGVLVLEVADTGAGFGATSAPLGGSSGLGLSGLKARLAALYGGVASLAIAENRPTGVRVTVRLPAGGIR